MDFFPDLSVIEHLELLAYAHAATDSGVAADVLAALDLDSTRDQLPATLSSGQRRRLALASCFVRPRRLRRTPRGLPVAVPASGPGRHRSAAAGDASVVPGSALGVWWALTLPARGAAAGRTVGWSELILALGVLLAAYRAASRRPTRYDGPAIDTPFGLIQPDLIRQLVRGIDVLAIVALAAYLLR